MHKTLAELKGANFLYIYSIIGDYSAEQVSPQNCDHSLQAHKIFQFVLCTQNCFKKTIGYLSVDLIPKTGAFMAFH